MMGHVVQGAPLNANVMHSMTYKKKGCFRLFESSLSVEAAGIEPASRDASTLASTCVVGLLRPPEGNPFAHCGAVRQAPQFANPNQFLARRVSSRTTWRSRIATGFQATLAIPISPGYLFLGGQLKIFISN